MAVADHPYVIGIDLGTTNSALSYADLRVPGEARQQIKIFPIPQLTGLGEFVRLKVLPSFLYIPGNYDIDKLSIQHPWPTSNDNFVGSLARDHGAKVPGRLVSSAKSWLCHAGVDRNARILPWGAAEEVYKVSPVQATAAYLLHLRKAWNHSRGDEEELFLENQTVILTVPASFDEVARELTLAAAEMAGYRHVTLLEEPLAAFYSWLIGHETVWERFVQPQELILICDVGGGTTDFTLVSLTPAEGGSPRFERIAVGDHLILGGDNVDLALARRVELDFGQKRRGLSTDRWKALCHQCRQAKERILAGDIETGKITLMGAGSRLIAGTLSAELNRPTVEETVLEGFFPLVEPDAEKPPIQRAAITEFGLPYEAEPAVTRHLGRFLERHRKDVARAVGKTTPFPDLILFNGGALKPAIVQEKIRAAIRHWFQENDAARPRVLDNPDPDLAVALGAAYYGLVKTGRGVKVGSGSPRSYYLGVKRPQDEAGDQPQAALCLVERGMDEGARIELCDKKFEVLANQPVRFDLFSSSFRSGDRCGQLVTIDDTFAALPPLATVVQFGKKAAKTLVPVTMEAEFTEMGTLALWCRSLISDHRWQLAFQLRAPSAAVQIEERAVLDAKTVEAARALIGQAFGSAERAHLEAVVKQISQCVDLARDDWPLSLIRELADSLLSDPAVRSRSALHEARWMNLTGYCLRPGMGHGFDSERIAKAWKVHGQGVIHTKNAQVRSEWWIMWRRIAGGLTPGQQRQLIQEMTPLLSPAKGAKIKVSPQEQLEIWMAVANLERLYVKDKIRWGRLLLSQIQPLKSKAQHLWSLSRIGARQLLYGPADRVIPPAEAAVWITHLLGQTWPNPKPVAAAITQLARRTGDRTRDLEKAVIDRVLAFLVPAEDFADQRRYLTEVIPMAKQEEGAIFGESLPSGIVLREG